LCVYVAVALVGCNSNNQDKVLLSIENDFKELSSSKYKISKLRVKSSIKELANADRDTLAADYLTRKYYKNNSEYLWISKEGITPSSALLIDSLEALVSIGFSPRKFISKEVKKDIEKIQTLSIEEGESISKILARIEYRLTKALFRYAIGERFGYVTPNYILNRLDTAETKNGAKRYQRLYDIHTETVDTNFVHQLVSSVANDSLQQFLNRLRSERPLYRNFQSILKNTSARSSKMKVLVNMERSRWRQNDFPELHKKYVLVNVPSFYLRAVDEDSVLSMRVACGALSTKTPLLNSAIERMDVNPQWVMPLSIVKKQIISQLGNRYYFDSHRYFIRDRVTGKSVPLEDVTRDMIESGKYAVVQEGGEGNSLGRIIFRFDNDLSIYLHDTSSKDVFARENRGVSHGCVRVQYPYELATFLIGNDNTKMLSRIRYSMSADVSSLGRGRERLSSERLASADTLKRSMLIGSVNVTPKVPVHIVYYTIVFIIN